MKISEIEKEMFYEYLWSNGGFVHTKYDSASGKYELELIYAGEYPHGDSYFYCQLIEKSESKVIWEYKKGNEIRQISTYPWSPDSKTIYFGLIEDGNKIAKYDINAEKLNIIFKSRYGEPRINWIQFTPQTFNGVVIMSNFWFNKEEFVEFLVYINETGELIELKHYFSGQKYPCPSNVLDCVYVIDNENINLFNIKSKQIIEKESNSFLKAGFFPKNKPYYHSISGETYLQLHNQTEEKFIKII